MSPRAARLLVLRGFLRRRFVVGVKHAERGEADEEPGGDVSPRVVQQRVLAPRVRVHEGVVAASHGGCVRGTK